MTNVSLALRCGLLLAVTQFASGQSAQITEIEVNQAIGKQLGGKLNFVAGKDTVVRAFLAAPVTVDADQTRLVILRDGTEVATLAPKAEKAPVSIVEFRCPSREACGAWAAGNYVFNATVNGATLSTNGTKYEFVTRIPLRILVRPVKANYNGTITTVQGERWRRAWEYLKHVYPVASDQILWDIRDEFDASDAKYNLETDDGQRALWESLTNQMPPQCAAAPKGPGCYDLIVGFISDRPNTYPNGQLQGYTFGKPTNIVVASDQDMEGTVAHEIAHLFAAGDEYTNGSINCNVNPAPDTTPGKDFNSPHGPVQCKAGKVTHPEADSSLIPAAVHPYEVGGRGALPDVASFMGSGGPQSVYWISPEIYNAVFDGLDPAKFHKPESSKARGASAPIRYIEFDGFMNEQGNVDPSPWYSFLSEEVVPDSTGDTRIEAVDAAGNVLASQKIEVEFFTLSNPPRVVDWAPFQGAIRFPENATSFRIVRNSTTVYEVAVSAHDPQVSDVSPVLAGATLDGPYTITWNGIDTDGDHLTYTVEYNPEPDNPASDWYILESDLESPQYEEDFSFLPGGSAAQLRVTATDGLRTASAVSQRFTVPEKAPFVYVDFPQSGDIYLPGEEVLLAGEALDVKDDVIPDSSMVWTSSLDGVLGRGPELIVTKLRAGKHTITLTATNKAGLKASESIQIEIAGTTAVAGPKNATVIQSVFQLDGSGSISFDGKPLKYQWTVPPGSLPAGILRGDTATPTIQFGQGRGVYRFLLTVTDSAGNTSTDTVEVTYLR